MAQYWSDPEEDDDDVNDFDESKAGPEYWMHKREKYTRKSYARCLKCGMKQELFVDQTGVYAVCPNKRCEYQEVITEWKV
jgi:hypothetical protein